MILPASRDSRAVSPGILLLLPHANYNCKSIRISPCILHIHFYTKNLLFLFYTFTFIKYPHQFIYFNTSFIKIINILNFFIISSTTNSRVLGTHFLSHLYDKALSLSLSFSVPALSLSFSEPISFSGKALTFFLRTHFYLW